MSDRCHYPGCNYQRCQWDKRQLFRLPSDPEKRQRLLDQLELPVGLVINLSTFFICSEHFAEGSLVVSGERILLGKNPTIKGREHLQKFSDKTGTFSEFIAHYQAVVGSLIEAFDWKVLTNAEEPPYVCFYTEKFDIDQGLSVAKNLIIKSDMSYRLINHGKLKVQKKLKLWDELAAILSDDSNSALQQLGPEVIAETAASSLEELLLSPSMIEDPDATLKLKFLVDQLRNLFVHPSRRRYSTDTTCAAIMARTMSSTAYDCLKSYLTLPTEGQLQKLSSKRDDEEK